MDDKLKQEKFKIMQDNKPIFKDNKIYKYI